MALLERHSPQRAGEYPKYVCSENNCIYIANNPKKCSIEQYQVDGEVFPHGSGPERCDYLLLNETSSSAYYIELKGSSIPKARNQIDNSVKMLKALHPKCTNIRCRIIYFSNSQEVNSSDTIRWKMKYGVQNVIIKSRKLEENI